ncbi:MAG: NudC domain-containing protein, partial [Candidatus Fonsibacter sp.]
MTGPPCLEASEDGASSAADSTTDDDQAEPASATARREPHPALAPTGDCREDRRTAPYTWRQTPAEVEIAIPIQQQVSSKYIQWKLSRNRITVGKKGDVVFDGDLLAGTLAPDGNHGWQFDIHAGQRCMMVSLEKRRLGDCWPS